MRERSKLMIKMMKNLLRICFFRAITLYFLVGLVVVLTVDTELAKIARVNFLKDYASYPQEFSNRRLPFDQKKFRFARKYYQALEVAIPVFEKKHMVLQPAALSRAYAMIGACDYYLGDTDSALGYFKKAVLLEPRQFWIDFNIGLVYFKQGQYSTAVGYFKKAFVLKRKDLVELMQLDILEKWPLQVAKQYEVLSFVEFEKLVRDSYKLTVLAYERMGQFDSAKEVALVAYRLGVGRQDSFFEQRLGLKSAKPQEHEEERFDLFYNVSQYFVPIGQEKFFIQRHSSGNL